MKKTNISRRQFLRNMAGTGIATSCFAGTLGSLAATQALAATGDYRALVCVFLLGGNDSFNMVVPTDADQYAQYAAIRSDLALDNASLLPLSGLGTNGRSYGLHPGMPELQSLYANGDAAIVANVGTLLEAGL